jgi:hypothetical protein
VYIRGDEVMMEAEGVRYIRGDEAGEGKGRAR